MSRLFGLAVLAFVLGGSGAAHAEPGMANQVYSPYVKKGVTEIELRGGRLNGGSLDGESAGVIEVEHGFSDRLSLAVLAEFEHHAGEKNKLDAIAVEGVAYLGQIPTLGIDVGAYLEYEQRIHAESGKVEAKLLLAKRSGGFETRLNLIANRALTDKPGEDVTQFGYAAQTTWETGHDVQLGVQAFGELGTGDSLGGHRRHYLGPLVAWELHPKSVPGELEFEAAYLLPLGQARHDTDGQVRVKVAWERRF